MPEAELLVAQEKLEELVASGFKLFNEGKSREAMMVAETAVASNPSSTGALSLKGMCHEHLGEIAEALECYEAVVNLNPDSALDRIKVNDLRNLLVARVAPVAATDKRPLLIAAVAAGLLVITVGAIAARGLSNREPARLEASNTVTNPGGTEASAFPESTVLNQTNPQTQTQNQTQSQPNQVQNQNQNQPNGFGQNNATPEYNGPRLGRNNEIELPNASGSTNPVTFPPDRIMIDPLAQRNTGNTTQPRPPDKSDPVVDPVEPPTTQPNTDPPKRKGDGIEISISNGSPNPGSGGSDGGSSANSLQTLLKVAVNNLEAKRYPEAARGFERVIGMGQGTARNYQRLADCYKYMGRSNDAIIAYERAADIHKSNGNPVGEEACRQQVKVLRGG